MHRNSSLAACLLATPALVRKCLQSCTIAMSDCGVAVATFVLQTDTGASGDADLDVFKPIHEMPKVRGGDALERTISSCEE